MEPVFSAVKIEREAEAGKHNHFFLINTTAVFQQHITSNFTYMHSYCNPSS